MIMSADKKIQQFGDSVVSVLWKFRWHFKAIEEIREIDFIIANIFEASNGIVRKNSIKYFDPKSFKNLKHPKFTMIFKPSIQKKWGYSGADFPIHWLGKNKDKIKWGLF